MPFFWETDRACRYIARALEKRRGEVTFPWQMSTLIRWSQRLIPTAILEFFLARSVPRPKP